MCDSLRHGSWQISVKKHLILKRRMQLYACTYAHALMWHRHALIVVIS